jgi:hypothetical protein
MSTRSNRDITLMETGAALLNQILVANGSGGVAIATQLASAIGATVVDYQSTDTTTTITPTGAYQNMVGMGISVGEVGDYIILFNGEADSTTGNVILRVRVSVNGSPELDSLRRRVMIGGNQPGSFTLLHPLPGLSAADAIELEWEVVSTGGGGARNGLFNARTVVLLKVV